ncbi:alpha/beta hydrolase [Burkholderia vietnamiensis]|uniref:alpha/beta hydrolase n=1 Tax=Burkholderia vietnamiensis TaxID=60552 RepID=UPI001592AFEB|nr:alpha/beta hydrolase [Burkholderia vietnamiensis]MBR7998731.1 alpha/beta hydrolase [Burkholderia vietnamiensis]
MNLKVALAVLSVLVAAALLAAHSPLRLLNALTPTNTFRLFADIPYGPGERQVLDVYLPARVARDWPTEPNAGAPVVVFFYGGSWQSGRRNDYLFVGEALASRGFVAVVPDYRTYPATTFPGFIDDAARAVAWARRHAAAFGGDPRRVFLMGHSAGAQIAALLATDGRYLAASEMRSSEIAGVIGLAGPYDFLPLRDATLERIFPGDQRAASQPIRFVRGNEPPMWLAVAENDTVVEPGNTDRFARALQNAGDSVVVTRYRHLSHAALVGVLGAPLRRAASVLDDLSAFVERAGGASNAGVASSDTKQRAATVASPVSAQ